MPVRQTSSEIAYSSASALSEDTFPVAANAAAMSLGLASVPVALLVTLYFQAWPSDLLERIEKRTNLGHHFLCDIYGFMLDTLDVGIRLNALPKQRVVKQTGTVPNGGRNHQRIIVLDSAEHFGELNARAFS